MESLYKRLGGEGVIEQAVDILYAKVLTDSRLASFFDDLDISIQRRKFRMFLNTVTQGPFSRSAVELRASHAHVVSQGVNAQHVNAFLEHFYSALVELGVPPDVTGEIMEQIALTRDDVLGL